MGTFDQKCEIMRVNSELRLCKAQARARARARKHTLIMGTNEIFIKNILSKVPVTNPWTLWQFFLKFDVLLQRVILLLLMCKAQARARKLNLLTPTQFQKSNFSHWENLNLLGHGEYHTMLFCEFPVCHMTLSKCGNVKNGHILTL